MQPDRRPRRSGEPWWRPADPATGHGVGDGPEGDGDLPMALDRELEPLAADLEAAGARARGRLARSGGAEPDARFAADLRARLLAEFPAAHAARTAPTIAAGAGVATRATGATAAAPLAEPAPTGLAGPGTASMRPWETTPATSQPSAPVTPVPDVPVRIAPRTMRQLPSGFGAPRWAIVAVAAVLILAVVSLDANLVVPARPAARSADAVGAVLVRDGAESALRAGAELHAGDVVRVGTGGHALLDLSAGQARLSSGATLRIITAAADRLELEQLTGRIYHRVSVAAGGTYLVRTGPVTWTAVGTAFDLDREAAPAGDGTGAGAPPPSGAETVRELSLQHDVRVDGAGLSATIAEGRSATIQLSGAIADLAVRSIAAADLADPWLLANARRDLEAGLPLGVMSGIALLEGSPSPSAPPTTVPATTPPATAAPTATVAAPSAPAADPTTGTTPAPATATPRPTTRPTPKPTPTPTPVPTPVPTPTPAPTLGTLSLALTPCEGQFVVATWSKWLGSGFNHYQGLRSAGSSIPVTFPPSGDVTAPSGLYSNVATSVTGIDSGLAAGSTYWYRAVAYDAANGPLAASGALSMVAKASKALGLLSIQTTGPTSTAFSWTPYGGAAACFTYYKLVYSATDPSPSYLTGSAYLWVSSTRTDAAVTVDSIAAGTYWFRLEALRSTAAGHIVVASTDVASFTVP